MSGTEFFWFVLVSAALSLGLGLILVQAVTQYALVRGWLDIPGGRKIHASATPRIGGVSIAFAFWAGMLSLLLLHFLFDGQFIFDRFGAVMIGSVAAFTLGIFDDIHGIGAKKKLIIQLGLAGIVYLLGGQIHSLFLGDGVEVNLGIWSFPFTIFWIAGFMNALNLIDGLNGLASGIAGLGFLTLTGFSLVIGNWEIAAMSAVAFTANIGFFRQNFPKGKIFMGDSGSMLLGFLLATLSLYLMSFPSPDGHVPLFVPLLIMGVPFVDMLVAISRRTIRILDIHRAEQKKGLPCLVKNILKCIFSADGDHIHHRLLSRGLSPVRVTLTLLASSLSLSIFACGLWMLPAGVAWTFFLVLSFLIIQMIAGLDYAEFAPRSVRKSKERSTWDESFGSPGAIVSRVSK